MQTGAFFHALSDATRRQILVELIERGDCCVCHLYETLDMAQPKVSRHLAVLREAELVQTRRDGLWVHYSLNPELPEWARAVLESMAEGQNPASIKRGRNGCVLPANITKRRRSNA
jgi:ArsR family transcriptional regulator, arsenate/arsenite/antimonite-responsive transcriptional repressor